MNEIKLIALDIDGTLLDDSKDLPPANREALSEASRRGVRIAIASGRMTSTIVPIEEMLGIDCIIMAYNGARIVGPKSEGRPLIAYRPLPADVAEIFIRFSRDHRYPLNFYHDEKLYAAERFAHQPLTELYSSRTSAAYDLVPDLDRFLGVSPTKLILLADPPDRDRLYEEFRAMLGSRAFITKSEPEYLEVMDSGVDKGSGLLSIAQHYGVALEETMAIGDGQNDLEMIIKAGWGVAMANSRPQVKAAARVVTERTNNDGGVAEAVERWVLRR